MFRIYNHKDENVGKFVLGGNSLHFKVPPIKEFVQFDNDNLIHPARILVGNSNGRLSFQPVREGVYTEATVADLQAQIDALQAQLAANANEFVEVVTEPVLDELPINEVTEITPVATKQAKKTGS